jgi:hypothetical protein
MKKWNAVALWSWDIVVDTCAICRNHIMDLCIECQANQVPFEDILNFDQQTHDIFKYDCGFDFAQISILS